MEMASADPTVAELRDAVGRVQAAVDSCMSRPLEALEALRLEHVPQGDAAAAFEEREFDLKVLLSRATAGLKRIVALVSTLDTRLSVKCDEATHVSLQLQEVRRRNAMLEAAEGRRSSSTSSAAAAAGSGSSTTFSPEQLLLLSERLGGASATTTVGDGPSAARVAQHHCSECASAGEGQKGLGGGEPCVHRSILASNIIDHTFSEHTTLLRKRLDALEAEVAALRSGKALTTERQRADDATQALRVAQDRFDEEKQGWLKVLSTASRMRGGEGAGVAEHPPPRSASQSLSYSAMTAANHIALVNLLSHSFLMASFREAQLEMKALLVSEHFARLAWVPAKEENNTPTTPAVVSGPPTPKSEADARRLTDARSRRTLLPASSSSSSSSRLAPVGSSPRRSVSDIGGGAAGRGTVVPEPPSGGSGVHRKPLHSRR